MDQVLPSGYVSFMSFSDRLTQARKRAEKTQKEIALAMGVSVQAVSQWEKGQVEINKERIKLLSEILEVDAVWLESGERNNKLPTPLNYPNRLSAKDSYGHYTVEVWKLKDVPKLIRSLDVMKNTTDRSNLVDVLYAKGYSSICFAVSIEEDVLSPDLCEGDIAIFDPQVGAEVGDIIIALVSFSGFMQLGHSPSEEPLVAVILKRGEAGAKFGEHLLATDQKLIMPPNDARPHIFILGTMVERRTFRKIK